MTDDHGDRASEEPVTEEPVAEDRVTEDRASAADPGEVEVGEAPPTRPTTGWLERAAGFVLFAYVLWFVVELVVLRSNPLLFDRMHEVSGALGARLAISVVAFALVYHALSGLRFMVLEAVRSPSARLHTVLDTGVVFLTFALALPASAIVLEPWIQGHLL